MPKKITKPKSTPKKVFHKTMFPAVTTVVGLSLCLLLVAGFGLALVTRSLWAPTVSAAGGVDRSALDRSMLFSSSLDELRGFMMRLGQQPLELEKVNTPVPVTPGRWLLSAMLASKGDRLLYTEVDPCVRSQGTDCTAWNTHTYLLNYEKNGSTDVASSEMAIRPSSNVESCGGTFLPLGWTENDKKIVWQLENLGADQETCIPVYLFFTSDVNHPEQLMPVATGDAFFTGSYTGVVSTDYSDKTMAMDTGPGSEAFNRGKLVYRNLETDKVTVLKQQTNTNYTIRPDLTGRGTVGYDLEELSPVKNCTPLVDCYSKAKKVIKTGLKIALPKP